MIFIDQFLDMMTQEVTVVPVTTNAYGAPTYGTPVSYPCRIEGQVMTVKGLDGRETQSTIQVYVGDQGIGLTPHLHRYILPYPFIPSGHRVAISVTPEFDETGPAFCVVYLP